MMRTCFLTGILVLAAAAAAQAQTPRAQPPASPHTTVLPPGSTPSASNRPTAQQVSAMVTRQFPTRDLDRSGSLSREEFAAWVAVLVTRRGGGRQVAAPPDLAERTALAFTQADADRSDGVSVGEMTALLTHGM